MSRGQLNPENDTTAAAKGLTHTGGGQGSKGQGEEFRVLRACAGVGGDGGGGVGGGVEEEEEEEEEVG